MFLLIQWVFVSCGAHSWSFCVKHATSCNSQSNEAPCEVWAEGTLLAATWGERSGWFLNAPAITIHCSCSHATYRKRPEVVDILYNILHRYIRLYVTWNILYTSHNIYIYICIYMIYCVYIQYNTHYYISLYSIIHNIYCIDLFRHDPRKFLMSNVKLPTYGKMQQVSPTSQQRVSREKIRWKKIREEKS